MPNSAPKVITPHYSPGELPLAFMFSVPGAMEKSASAPVAGATGENLSFALEHLHRSLPDIFISPDRYAYRITNAYGCPMARSLNHKNSEATDAQIHSPANIARVLQEIKGCRIIILCGRKAQLLSSFIDTNEQNIVCAWHTSNQALAGKYNFPEVRLASGSLNRRKLRAKLWAQDVLRMLQNCNKV